MRAKLISGKQTSTGNSKSGNKEEPAIQEYWSHTGNIRLFTFISFIEFSRRNRQLNAGRSAKKGWSIVAADSLTMEPLTASREGKPVIYSDAAEALRKLKQRDPARAAGLKIMRLSELSWKSNDWKLNE